MPSPRPVLKKQPVRRLQITVRAQTKPSLPQPDQAQIANTQMTKMDKTFSRKATIQIKHPTTRKHPDKPHQPRRTRRVAIVNPKPEIKIRSTPDKSSPHQPAPLKKERAKQFEPLSSHALLNSISGIDAEVEPLENREPPVFLNPKTQQRYLQALQKQAEQPKNEDETEGLTVDEFSIEMDGYRYAEINGQCWWVPVDTGFDSLSIPLMMPDFDCSQPQKNPLAERLQKWLPKNKDLLPAN